MSKQEMIHDELIEKRALVEKLEEQNDKLKTELRGERMLSLEYEARIQTLESAMQEFREKAKVLAQDQTQSYLSWNLISETAKKFKQLLEQKNGTHTR